MKGLRVSGLRQLTGIIVVMSLMWLGRDWWLGAPVIAFAWLAHQLGAMCHAAIIHVLHPMDHSLTWPNWSWQELANWYRPGISWQWRHIWADPILRQQTLNLFMVIAGALFLVVVMWWIRPAPPVLSTRKQPWKAHWATERELRELTFPVGQTLFTRSLVKYIPQLTLGMWQRMRQVEGDVQVSDPPALYAGRYIGRERWLPLSIQEGMILLVATTGSGKSSRWIIPSILRETGYRSLYIPDPKSELWRVTAGAVAKFHRVWRFAPSEPDHSQGYNPLAYVTDRRSARKFADVFLQNTGESSGADSYWTNLARSLIIGMALHAKALSKDAPLSWLIEWFTSHTLPELTSMLSKSLSKDARDVGKTIAAEIEKNPRVEAVVMPDLSSRWDQLKSPETMRVTAQNDLDFAAMTQESIALYVCVVAGDRTEFAFLTACLMMQMFEVMGHVVRQAPKGRLPKPIVCYLDEFTNQGRIPDIVTYLSMLRSAGVAFFIAVQSFAQIRGTYNADTLESIRGICNTLITLPGSGLEECEYFARRIGETTVTPHSASRGYDPNSSGIRQLSYSAGETRRELMTADEIRRMPLGHALVIVRNLPAFVSEVPAFFEVSSLHRLTAIEPPYLGGVIALDALPQALSQQSLSRIAVSTGKTVHKQRNPKQPVNLIPLPDID